MSEHILHCCANGAHKFWRAQTDGATLHVRWGRIGTSGQSLSKTFADAAEAQKEAERQATAKRGRGYVPVTAAEAEAVAPRSLTATRQETAGQLDLFAALEAEDEPHTAIPPPIPVSAPAPAATALTLDF